MGDLTELAQKWHTDKVISEKEFSHDYIHVYEHLLKDKPVRKVMEIGLGWPGLMHRAYEAGASLRMWAEYFPEAEVYGLDIRPDALVNEGRIHSYLCDQSNIGSLLNAKLSVGENFDLIVDDGSHIPYDQALTASVFVPLLSETGIYVIEDVYPGKATETLLGTYSLNFEVIECRLDRVENDRLILMERQSCLRGKS